MKRGLVMLCVVGIIAAIPLCTVATAAKKETKVAICHVNSANDVVDLGGGVALVFGKIIEVPEAAVEAHLAHGDSREFIPLTEDLRDELEGFFGICLRHADAYFFEIP